MQGGAFPTGAGFLKILQNDNRMCKIVIRVDVRTAGVAAGGSGVQNDCAKGSPFSAKGPAQADSGPPRMIDK